MKGRGVTSTLHELYVYAAAIQNDFLVVRLLGDLRRVGVAGVVAETLR